MTWYETRRKTLWTPGTSMCNGHVMLHRKCLQIHLRLRLVTEPLLFESFRCACSMLFLAGCSSRHQQRTSSHPEGSQT